MRKTIAQFENENTDLRQQLASLRQRLAQLRQRLDAQGDLCLTVGPLSMDRLTRVVSVDGRMLDLSPGSYRLLELLMLRAGETVTVGEIEAGIWGPGEQPVAPSLLPVLVHRLRAALGPQAGLIKNVRGDGYMIRAEETPK